MDLAKESAIGVDDRVLDGWSPAAREDGKGENLEISWVKLKTAVCHLAIGNGLLASSQKTSCELLLRLRQYRAGHQDSFLDLNRIRHSSERAIGSK